VKRQDEPVGHPVHAPQHLHDLEQDLMKVGIEVAEHRPRHGVEHGRVDVGGAGAAEQPLRRAKLGMSLVHAQERGAP
jgi:hypothetical protein